MKKEILMVVETVSNEKDVDKELIFAAIEAALATATKKKATADIDVRVTIDRRTGDYKTFRCWKVIPDVELVNDSSPIAAEAMSLQCFTLAQARQRNPQAKLGDVIEELVPSVDFSRIDAQMAKQVIIQKIREAERITVAQTYQHRVGELLTGVVKRVSREGIILDLGGNAEGFIPREEMIPREEVRVNDRVRAYLYEVQSQTRGPQLLMSRIRPEMLVTLFKVEVPEIGEELIAIKGAARDPGLRAKIAVKTNDGRIDPIGACVGMRGARVQAVSSELNGERIDIVLWDDNPAQLVINTIAPAEVTAIVMDENTHSMEVAVQADQLSQAIGRNGQNVRLASELTGWDLKVVTVEDAAKASVAESENLQQLFIDQLVIDEGMAEILVREGFTSLEEVAYVSKEEILKIEEFDDVLVDTLQSRARDALLAQALATSEPTSTPDLPHDLRSLEGMCIELEALLLKQGISNREALAELAVDDLLELTSLNREEAAKLIMAARAHWFN